LHFQNRVQKGSVPLALKRLEQDLDGAPAGQPSTPGGLLGDTELEEPNTSLRDNISSLGDHVDFDAAS
jgi:hypothetical protein